MKKNITKTRLKELRLQKGLSQFQVSKILEISQVTYSGYELNKRLISIPMLIKLADLYGTSIDYILYLTDDPTPKKRISRE